MGAKRRPPLGLHPLAGESQDLGDRGLEVVVGDLAEGNPAQHAKRVGVAFEERLLAAGEEDAMYGLAGVGQAQAEQVADDLFAVKAHGDVTEVDLGLGAGLVALGDEGIHRSEASLDADLQASFGNVVAHDPVGQIGVLVFVQEAVGDPHRSAGRAGGCDGYRSPGADRCGSEAPRVRPQSPHRSG